MKIIVIFFSLLLCAALAIGEKSDHLTTRQLQFYDPLNRSLTDHRQFHQFHSPQSFIHQSAETAEGNGELSGEVVILVNRFLYPHLSLDTFISDITSMGYSVYLDTVSGGTCVDIRNLLYTRWNSQGAVGVIIIGELPVPWYALDDEVFPIDYYYMDLDGYWGDANNDDIFDSHSDGSGDEEADIWLGRLTATYCTNGDEASLVQNYLNKNHQYRIGNLSVPFQALAFNDDDWSYTGDPGLNAIYGSNVEVVENSTSTTETQYVSKLQNGYEYVHIMAHSSPWSHTFRPMNVGGTFYNFELYFLTAPVHFLNLFSCSGARYVERDNLGNAYIFRSDYGLGVVGSAKTGAMLYFSEFYTPLGNDSTFGGAFKEWMVINAEWSPSWFYGLTYLGDPTLKPGMSKDNLPNQIPPDPVNVLTVYVDSAKITNYAFTDGMPFITLMSNGYPLVVWSRCQDIRNDIFASYYNGSSWSTPAEISGSGDEYWDLYPQVIKDQNGMIYCFWQGYRWGNGYDIGMVSSSNNGISWSSPLALTSLLPYEVYPKPVLDSQGTMWCFFRGVEGGQERIYQVNKPLYGTWSSPSAVTWADSSISDFTVQVSPDSLVYLIFITDNNIYSMAYNGSYWTSPVLIEDQGFNYHLSAGTSEDYLFCSYHCQQGIKTIFNSAGSWQSPQIIPSTSSMLDLEPSAVSNPNPVVIWRRKESGNWIVAGSMYYNSSWSSPFLVAGNQGNSAMPRSISNGSLIHSAYCSDASGNWEIYYESTNLPSSIEEPVISISLGDVNFSARLTGNLCFELEYNIHTPTEIRIFNISGQEIEKIQLQGYGAVSLSVPSSGIYYITSPSYSLKLPIF